MESKKMSKAVLSMAFIGILVATVLFVAGCEMGENCRGDGQCTVTIGQGAHGLFIDNTNPRSTCGRGRTWNSDTATWSGGCRVQNNIDNHNRTFGTHSCSC